MAEMDFGGKNGPGEGSWGDETGGREACRSFGLPHERMSDAPPA